jgi:hypothetical protein
MTTASDADGIVEGVRMLRELKAASDRVVIVCTASGYDGLAAALSEARPRLPIDVTVELVVDNFASYSRDLPAFLAGDDALKYNRPGIETTPVEPYWRQFERKRPRR